MEDLDIKLSDAKNTFVTITSEEYISLKVAKEKYNSIVSDNNIRHSNEIKALRQSFRNKIRLLAKNNFIIEEETESHGFAHRKTINVIYNDKASQEVKDFLIKNNVSGYTEIISNGLRKIFTNSQGEKFIRIEEYQEHHLSLDYTWQNDINKMNEILDSLKKEIKSLHTLFGCIKFWFKHKNK